MYCVYYASPPPVQYAVYCLTELSLHAEFQPGYYHQPGFPSLYIRHSIVRQYTLYRPSGGWCGHTNVERSGESNPTREIKCSKLVSRNCISSNELQWIYMFSKYWTYSCCFPPWCPSWHTPGGPRNGRSRLKPFLLNSSWKVRVITCIIPCSNSSSMYLMYFAMIFLTMSTWGSVVMS